MARRNAGTVGTFLRYLPCGRGNTSFNPTPHFFFTIKKIDIMKKWQFTLLAVLLHLAFFSLIYAATIKPKNPETSKALSVEDTLLGQISYQNGQFAVYKTVGEAVISGKAYSITGTGYDDGLTIGIVCGPTGDYIYILPDGSTEYRFGNVQGVFVGK